jgi:hypothetical protein
MNVISFSSPIIGSIGGAQTKKNMVWYPIKANQPEIQFEVQFLSEMDYERFSDFVQDSQVWAMTATTPMVYLDWPERNINQWSGLISEFEAGGKRANPTPQAQFTVFLFDSFVSRYTEMSTIPANFYNSLGFNLQGFRNLIPNPYNLRLPNIPAIMPQVNQGPNTVIPTTEEEEQQDE